MNWGKYEKQDFIKSTFSTKNGRVKIDASFYLVFFTSYLEMNFKSDA